MNSGKSHNKLTAQKRFGSLIRDARLQLGFSQSYVSARMGMASDSYLSRIENGHRPPSKLHLNVLADVLAVSHDTLLDAYFDISRSEIEERGK